MIMVRAPWLVGVKGKGKGILVHFMPILGTLGDAVAISIHNDKPIHGAN
jgi:hypothetical protein